MNKCYLGLGSNQKFPERQIRQALQSIKKFPNTSITQVSNLYWNKAWGLKNQQDFCNIVVEILTVLTPFMLLHCCKQTELNQSRVRRRKNGPRTLDIDIILYGDRKIHTKDLKIPHPFMAVRDFVLVPLFEITKIHPNSTTKAQLGDSWRASQYTECQLNSDLIPSPAKGVCIK